MAKEETRKKILKAAEELFSRDGFDGVPTKVIAAEAGVTEMTLFNHFATRELLYRTVAKERYLAIEIDSLVSGVDFTDMESEMIKITDTLIGNFVSNRRVLMMRLKEKQNFRNDESFSVENDPLMKQIQPFFMAYEDKGVINRNGRKTALLFMAAFKGLCHIALLDNKAVKDIKALVDEYVGVFCHGVMA